MDFTDNPHDLKNFLVTLLSGHIDLFLETLSSKLDLVTLFDLVGSLEALSSYWMPIHGDWTCMVDNECLKLLLMIESS